MSSPVPAYEPSRMDIHGLTPREVAATLQERAGFTVQAGRGFSMVVDYDKLDALLDDNERLREALNLIRLLECRTHLIQGYIFPGGNPQRIAADALEGGNG